MAYYKFELSYQNIDASKLQKSYDEIKDSVKIEPIMLSEALDICDTDVYQSVKSWRSNALEGNTTKLKNLSKIINNKKDSNGKLITLVSNTQDEELEIINLKKAYSIKTKFNLGSIENINYILGEGIDMNDFNNLRGKLKRTENIIQYKVDEEWSIYDVNFCPVNIVKSELNKLLKFLNENINDINSFSNAFALAIIFNLEFNRIHPFSDGNGRTGRLIMEKIFEDNNFLPIIFATEESKSLYKKTLFNSDKRNDKYNYEDAINIFARIYSEESKEFIKILSVHNNT